jgi:signal transduction histidine kinase
MPSPLRILVVEDNPGDVRLVQETLRQDQRWPFEIVAEGRLSAGLERLRRERIDLVLLDLGLPDARGLGTFEDVQREAPAVPVVVLTGSDDQETALRAIQEGAQDYLVKGSVDGDRLWRSIRYGIERKKSEEAQRLAFERLGQIEELKVANQLKAQILSEATHELNTPLTPLKIQIQMLKSGTLGELTPGQSKAVAILERNLDRLRALLSDLLDVARLQSHRLTVRRQPLELSRLVRDAVETFEATAARTAISLEMPAAPETRVFADANRLTQVVVNFVSNALKFTPPGGRIRVALAVEGGEAVVRVADTGPGLTPEQIRRLFAPFSQVHDPNRIQAAGSGLGLYISKGILESHGGRAWCESDGPGRGATFCFAVPLADSEAKANEAPAAMRMVEVAA